MKTNPLTVRITPSGSAGTGCGRNRPRADAWGYLAAPSDRMRNRFSTFPRGCPRTRRLESRRLEFVHFGEKMYAVLALHDVRVGEVGQAVSPAKCQNMFEYSFRDDVETASSVEFLDVRRSEIGEHERHFYEQHDKRIYSSGERASAFGEMNPRITLGA